MDEEKLIEERKKNLISFIKKKYNWIIYIVLAILVWFAVWLRTLPMKIRPETGKPGLWDVTTNTWTLGPDLDPFLFLRWAKYIVVHGSLMVNDVFRYVPLGYDVKGELTPLVYMIAYFHKLASSVGLSPSIEYSAIIFPVFMFALTIIAFFLLSRKIFVDYLGEPRANIIALISSFFLIVIPALLPRTIAGIPEKESAAFFFMFLTFYFYLKSWKTENTINAIILGGVAGILTGIMGLIWGGVIYAFITIGLANFFAFFLNKVRKRNFLAYFSWIFFSFLILMYFSYKRYDVNEMFTSLSSGLAFLTLFIMMVHYAIWNTKLSKIKILNESRIPKTILSFIIAILVLIFLSIIFLGPSFILEKAKVIHQTIFKPIFGRWNITVAENKQPDFQEWSGSFGPHIKNIPLMFWLFFIGSIVLFKKMLLKIKNKDAWVLTFIYMFFVIGIVFSRYSGSSLFNGDNFISKSLYYIASLLFLGFLIYYYIGYYKRGDDSFKKIRFEYLILFSLFVLTLFTVRGAVRLIMVLGPVASIFVGFLIVEFTDRFFRTKDDIWKIIIGIFLILILISSFYSLFIYYKSVKVQAYGFVPSAYNIQWQKAMDWVRQNTQENAVFAHWWDYGYWLQSIGNRATLTDGGNAIVYWNYLTGRLVLTGDNQDDALEFLYNHNATHLLIDSTDIGKYGAFSSIGSDKDFDRYSFIGTFLQDESQTRETNNQTLYVLSGGVGLDEDLVIDGKLIPTNGAGIGAIILPVQNNNFQQPYIIVVYQGQQFNINLRYLFIKNQLIDFGSGIEATAFIFPILNVQNNNVKMNELGAAFYISPRLMRGMLSQVYIMNDPFKKFKNFKLIHTESSLVIDDLRNQGMALPDFVYFQGVQGPIKIWEIEYSGKEQIKEEYLDRDETKYIDWAL